MDTLRMAAQHLWAIQPSALEAALTSLAAGTPQAAVSARKASRSGSTVIMPIQGTLRQKGGGLIDSLFGAGGTSTEVFAANIRRLAADEGVGTVILDVHSHGGEVFGTWEAADAIWEARQGARIVGVVNSLAASAAYALVSQAHEVWASPSSMAGSIGVFAMHRDLSEAAATAGVKVTLISAGEHKTDGHEFAPLTDESRASVQKMVDGQYAQFVAAVARGRKVSQQAVRDGMGQGRVVSAKDAVSLGMADRVGSMRDALAALGTDPSGMRAMGDDLEMVAEWESVECTCTPGALYHQTECAKSVAHDATDTVAESPTEDDGDIDLRERRVRLTA